MRDALTVGINTYCPLPKLRAPANDAEAIASLLEQYSDFRVQRLPDVIRQDRPAVARKTPVTVADLESALVRLFKPSGAYVPHTALFYFSGHGLQRHVGVREGYLALSDSSLEGHPGLSLTWLRRLLQESPVRQQIVILDCCHSGELLTFLDADPGARPGVDRMFMVACREYEAAYESIRGQHSVLTEAIRDALDPRTCASGRVTNYSLANRVSQTLSGHIQQPLFENSGSEITLTTSGIQLPQPSRLSEAPCPYPGLAPFTVAQADLFFGREALTQQLIDRVVTQPLVTLVGAAGSGKTSLLQAGFMAQMRQGRAFPQSDRWRIRLMVPGDSPLKQLAAAFVDPSATGLERAEQLRRAESFIQDGGPGLVQLLRGNLLTDSSTGLGPRPRFVLIIDDADKLFLSGEAALSPQGQQMIEAIAYALQDAHGSFRVILGLRADFLGQVLAIPTLRNLVQPGLISLPPLTYEQLKAAVLKPAQQASLPCDSGLLYTLLFDVAGMPGELWLLQGTLRQLWGQQRSLTQAAYMAIGGVHGVLHHRASRVVQALSPEHHTAAMAIFFTLTQLGHGTEDSRRRVAKADLLQLAWSAPLFEETLEILLDQGLLVTSHSRLHEGDSARAPQNLEAGDISSLEMGRTTGHHATGGRATVDVVHDALIRRWPLLQTWLNQYRDRLIHQRQLADAALEWHHLNRPKAPEYLLQGRRLAMAEATLRQSSHSVKLLRQFVATSRVEVERSRWERRRQRLAMPGAMVLALVMGAAQHCSFSQPPPQPVQSALAQRFRSDVSRPPEAPLQPGQTIAVNYDAATIRQMAIAEADGQIKLWQFQTQAWPPEPQRATLTHTLAPPPTDRPLSPPHLTFSQDGDVLAVATQLREDRTLVQLWSTETGDLLQEKQVAGQLSLAAEQGEALSREVR